MDVRSTLLNCVHVKKNDRIDLRVPEGTKAEWEVEAERRGLVLSEVIRRAVPFYFEANAPARVRPERRHQSV